MGRELKKLQNLELQIAQEVVKICKKNDLPIFMLAGTALGAIRHKGFIPWDDDMDFGMLRSDFEKFKQLCLKELDYKKFFLQSDSTDTFYPFNFLKIRLEGTSVVEEFSQNASVHNGIYIDIFPLDFVARNPVKQFIQLKGFWVFRNLLWIRCGYGDVERRKTLVYKFLRFISMLLPINMIKKIKHFFITLAQNELADFVVVSDGSYGLKRETLPLDWINELDNYEFDGHKFASFTSIDSYLKHMYGDYMKIPDENSRNHHNRLKIDFGIYTDLDDITKV